MNWYTTPCSHGGVLLRRPDPDHPQSSLQIVPAEEGVMMAAAPEMADVLRDVVKAIMVTPRGEMDSSDWAKLADRASAALAKAGAL